MTLIRASDVLDVDELARDIDSGADGRRIVGVGVDLVELASMRRALERRQRLEERLFSVAEREYAHRQRDPTARLAARFAAKEAVMKALGVGLWKFKLRDVEVVKARSGAPSLAVAGRAAELARDAGVDTWHLTLTHTDGFALAIALALQEGSR